MLPRNGHGEYGPVVEERPLGDLFQDLAQEVRTLVGLEVALAKAEMSEKASAMGRAVAIAAAGGFVAYAGFLAVIAALVIGLANLIPAWLAALLVGVVVILVGYMFVRKGMDDLKGQGLAPRQTLDTLKENKEWVQRQVKQAERQP